MSFWLVSTEGVFKDQGAHLLEDTELLRQLLRQVRLGTARLQAAPPATLLAPARPALHLTMPRCCPTLLTGTGGDCWQTPALRMPIVAQVAGWHLQPLENADCTSR